MTTRVMHHDVLPLAAGAISRTPKQSAGGVTTLMSLWVR